jgi:hypothetical protein
MRPAPAQPAAEDGLLTAEDVAGMDLLARSWSCSPRARRGWGGAGREGVFGLRRSFQVAGARTLVMSLWKVPDESTAELMVDYYRRILIRGRETRRVTMWIDVGERWRD